MKKVCLLIFCLIFVLHAAAQPTREPLSEAERKLSDELKNDKDFVAVDCWLRRSENTADRDASYKLKAVQAFRGEGEKINLKKRCGTKEGDPIFSYLTVEKGRASIFVDTSQDEFGPQRVFSYQCEELDFGVYFNDLKAGRMVFQITDAANLKNDYPAVRCMAGKKEIIF
jgi:hypothetical protein